jgi:hypothetical protein
MYVPKRQSDDEERHTVAIVGDLHEAVGCRHKSRPARNMPLGVAIEELLEWAILTLAKGLV